MVDSIWTRERWAVFAVVVAALALRLYYIGWGLPFHYEEATPLKTAWSMGGWGTTRGVDLNPHFLNYPSLTIYLQFIAQQLLYAVMKFKGVVESGVDFYAQYLSDPTPFYQLGRAISVLFATATVWLVYRVGTRLAPNWAAIAAAGLMAVNTFHIERSHLIEVDVPLTFFVMLSFWLILRSYERPTRRNFITAGIAIGLATSSKYTGVMLVLPLALAYVMARRKEGAEVKWDFLPIGLTFATLAFVLTSPYVLLDSDTFARHFATERQHMRLGHFGATGSSTWVYYGGALAQRLLGIPASLLALVGIVYTAAIRRRADALILLAFVVPYVLGVSTWSMRADRYLLPVLPALLIFTTAGLGVALPAPSLGRQSRMVRIAVGVALMVAMAAPVMAAYPAYLRSIRSDTRTTSADWIESSIPSGSLIVTEPYGPDLFGPVALLEAGSAVRSKTLKLNRGRPNYGVFEMAMYQVRPERSAVLYNHELYEAADYFISTGAVRSRYEREPARFRQQVAFYDSLDAGYRRIADFKPGDGGGPRIIVYMNPRHTRPFSTRKTVPPPRRLRIVEADDVTVAPYFYYHLGVNYEVFLRLQEAISYYELALNFPMRKSTWFKKLVLRKTQCLMMMQRRDEALTFLDAMIQQSPNREDHDHLMRVRHAITGGPPQQ